MVADYDIVVIGGGPAGLMAAGQAAMAGQRVLLAEKMEKPARKLRITGKGRCNVTNTKSEEEFLAKVNSGREFFSHVFKQFSNHDTLRFFDTIGIDLITERGDRVFPKSGRAWDIADGMSAWAKRQGVDISLFTKIEKIECNGGMVTAVIAEIKGKRERISCRKVIIATGGASYPSTGSTGDGYSLAYELGHKIEPIRPALVPLEIECDNINLLKGLLLKNVSIKLFIDNEVAAERFGEMEFYQYGILGAITLQISGMAVDALLDNRQVEIAIDLKPALSVEKLLARIEREAEALQGAKIRVMMQKLIPLSLINIISIKAGLSENKPIETLTAEQKKQLVETLKSLRFKVTDFRPFAEAIVTAGGVDTTEISLDTLESKLVKGLYFAGEVIDIDADTGGYNIQIAISTGYVAGNAAAKQ